MPIPRKAMAILLLIALPLLSQERPSPMKFKDITVMKTWAHNHVLQFSHKGHDVAVATRSYTSGIQSGEIWVFVRSSSGWSEALKTRCFYMDYPLASQDGDTVSLVLQETKKEVLRFSIASLVIQTKENPDIF
jgi:hypothetical protein